MSKKMIATAIALAVTVTSSCATSPSGRKQLTLFSADEVAQVGAASFEELKKTQPISKDAALNRYVQCVANQVTAQVPKDVHSGSWEVVVFESEQVNAFALPGGKIGVYTGILNVARDQHQLAAIIGHEVAHVIANHSNERMSSQAVTQAGLGLTQQMLGGVKPETQTMILGSLSIGAQYGILMPYSRSHEAEADVIGQELMAQSGFKPESAVYLWQNMAALGQSAPPELLSSHPSNETRIEGLSNYLSTTQPLYENRKKLGNLPQCIKPN